MTQIYLNAEEEQTLRDVVRRAREEVDREINHTDSAAFREILKHRREVLTGLWKRLPESETVSS